MRLGILSRLALALLGAGLFLNGTLGAASETVEQKKEKDEAFNNRPSAGVSTRTAARSVYLTPRIITLTEKRILAAIWWDVDKTKPVTRMQVNLTEQKVYVYQEDRLAAISPISSGRPGLETPTGKFCVLEKEKDHKSTLYGEFVDSQGKVVDYNAEPNQPAPKGASYMPSPMPYFLRLTDAGVGLHSGYLPGYAASHGCVRLPESFAQELFEVVPTNTPVEVIP